eukprot:3804515-Rhodomonas_salina.1
MRYDQVLLLELLAVFRFQGPISGSGIGTSGADSIRGRGFAASSSESGEKTCRFLLDFFALFVLFGLALDGVVASFGIRTDSTILGNQSNHQSHICLWDRWIIASSTGKSVLIASGLMRRSERELLDFDFIPTLLSFTARSD